MAAVDAIYAEIRTGRSARSSEFPMNTEKARAPARTDRPYVAPIRALGHISRDSLGFIHRLQKTGSEGKIRAVKDHATYATNKKAFTPLPTWPTSLTAALCNGAIKDHRT